ncbi:hypothetical protein EST38_g13306 [Candolleomyces aberdarensis]|uniref:DUF6532 domain-containing protein n=1 Tax=Candolleomyces aberdarensis TaxID=2316362 RepID=A0A4Q2D099_9AGAR|nr:hypothetical protein EST38_g13306 [Candolleomyces aberdarensis]
MEKQEAEGIKAVAAIEDKIWQKQPAQAMNAEHPNIPTFKTYKEPTPDSTEDMDVDEIRATDGRALGASDVPDALALSTNSSEASDEEPSPLNIAGSSDKETSEDLLDEEELRVYRKLEAKIARKQKMAKGQLRDAVNEQRKVKPMAHSIVKKMDMVVDSEDKDVEAVVKKKPTALEGFKKGWDKPLHGAKPRSVPATSARAKSQSTPAAITATVGFEDEQAMTVIAARTSKATALSQKGGTAKVFLRFCCVTYAYHKQMGITLKKVEISDAVKASAVPQKKHYSSKDLPLTDIEDGMKRWQDEVMPIVLSWASTLHDPFGINGDPALEQVVQGAWEEVFEDEDAPFTSIFVHVAGASIQTWRSQIGSKALKLLRQHFNGPEFHKKSSRAGFIENQLKQCRYIYEDPEQMTGAYQSPLLLKVYAHHQSQVQGTTDTKYGRPVGALAFAATALERALKLWKGGVEVEQNERPNFVRRPWAKRVEWHVNHLKDIGDRRWVKIENSAAKYLTEDKGGSEQADSDNEEIGSNVEVVFSDLDAEDSDI